MKYLSDLLFKIKLNVNINQKDKTIIALTLGHLLLFH